MKILNNYVVMRKIATDPYLYKQTAVDEYIVDEIGDDVSKKLKIDDTVLVFKEYVKPIGDSKFVVKESDIFAIKDKMEDLK